MPSTKPAKFLSEVKSELSKVTWPTREEVIRLTAVVIVISLIVGLFVGALDFIFTKGIEVILRR
ncbi:MAG TPA: preprotein translocase subunit SecE [Clostridia bacterium]|nr:preprotein translocase subunit SecE [Clostridia bacterium]